MPWLVVGGLAVAGAAILAAGEGADRVGNGVMKAAVGAALLVYVAHRAKVI